MVAFTAVLEQTGITTTGIRVPDEVVAALAAGKRIPVRVRLNDHEYRSTVMPYGGATMLSVSAENREAAGVAAGDEVAVELEVDREERVVDVPDDLAAALDAAPGAREAFERLPRSGKQRHVLSVTGAKTQETRDRRVAKAVAELAGQAASTAGSASSSRSTSRQPV